MTGSRRHGVLLATVPGLIALLLAPPTWAQKESSFTVGELAYKKLTGAQELMGEERYAEASKALDELAKKKLNDHETALLHQTRGYILSSTERWDAAIEAFRSCLAQDALPPGAQLGVRYNLAQLYLMRERYGEAQREFELWFAEAENPGSEAWYMLATAYALGDDYGKALRPAEKAVATSATPKQRYLQLLLTLYFEKRDFPKLAGVLERLVTHFPKKSYWMQLAAVYAELGRDEQSLAVTQLAYQQGLLTEDAELRRLAQLYLYNQLPYRAALVMEEALESGAVESDPEAWELLANSWVQAHEFERSLPALERAAQLSDTGDLYTRLGQIHLERQEWAKAERALARALEQGKLEKRGKTWVLLGVARYSADRLDPAAEAFAKAREFESSRSAASQWLTHIERQRTVREN